MTAIPVLGSIGTQVDLTLRTGDTLGPFALTLTNKETGAAINLTGGVLSAAMSKLDDPGSDIPLVATVTDAPGGKCSIKLADTTTLVAGSDYYSATEPLYAWRLRFTDAAGTIQTLLFGQVFPAPGALP